MRTTSLLLLALLASPAMGEQLQSTGGTTFVFDNGGRLVSPSAFQKWPALCVRSSLDGNCDDAAIYAPNDAPVLDSNLSQYTLPAAQLAGLTVQRRVYSPNSDTVSENANNFFRIFDTFRNTTTEPITVHIRYGSVANGQGSIKDNNAKVLISSIEDDELTVDDRWILLDDENENGGTSALGVVIYGAGATQKPVIISQGYPDSEEEHAGAIYWEYQNITIAPSETIALLTMIVHEANRDAARAELQQLQSAHKADAVKGLSTNYIARIANFGVRANSQYPVIEAGGPYVTNEGSSIMLEANATSELAGTLTYSWDLDGDGDFDDSSTARVQFNATQNGVYFARAKVVNSAHPELFDIDTARIEVRNVPPSLRVESVSPTIDEGAQFSIRFIASDVGTEDHITFDFDWDGDGVYEETDVELTPDENNGYSYSHLYVEPGNYAAHMRAKDGDGGESVANFSASIKNYQPELTSTSLSETENIFDQGIPTNVSIWATDRGVQPLKYQIDIARNGRVERTLTTTTSDRPAVIPVTLFDIDTYTLSITVCDSQLCSNTITRTVRTQNIAPQINGLLINGQENGIAYENVPIEFTVLAYDASSNLSYSFDFNGDRIYEVGPQSSPSVAYTYDYTFTYSVGVKVSDGQSESQHIFPVYVENAPPIFDASAFTLTVHNETFAEPYLVTQEGADFSLTAKAHDLGDNVITYDWDLDGDGEFELLNAGPTVRGNLREEGEITLNCRATDGRGASTVRPFTMFVENATPTVDFVILSDGLPMNTDESGYYHVQPGVSVTLAPRAEEPGLDTLTYDYDIKLLPNRASSLNDYEISEIQTQNATLEWSFSQPGTADINLKVTDESTYTPAVINGHLRVIVDEIAPRVTLRSNSPVKEGESLRFNADIDDPGETSFKLRWNVFGTGEEIVVTESADQIHTYTFTTTDNKTYAASITVEDEAGHQTTVGTVAIIQNAAPTFVTETLPAATEGHAYNTQIVASDPAGENDVITYSLLNPPADSSIDPQTGVFAFTPTWAQCSQSPISITVRADDGDGGLTQKTFLLDIIMRDDDRDGLPDSWEAETCADMADPATCLDPTNMRDAERDPDNDGRSTLLEYTEGTNPFEFDGPFTPELMSPNENERIHTATPTLKANLTGQNIVDTPSLATVSAVFEIWSAKGPEVGQKIWESPSIQVEDFEESGTVVDCVVDDNVLEEDVTYTWRVQALSGPAESNWSPVQRFTVNAENTLPTPPTPRSPANGSAVDTVRPTLEVRPSFDADGDELNYVFRVYRGATGSSTITNGAGKLENGVVSFTIGSDLTEDGTFSWDVVAQDTAGGISEPSARWSFVVDTENHTPSEPTILYPEDGVTVTSLNPVFKVDGSIDLDPGQTFSYIFKIVKENEVIEESARITANANGEAQFQLNTPLEENQTYTLEVYAIDEYQAASSIVSRTFFVSSIDEAPATPAHVSPTNGAALTTEEVILTWSPVSDPEGDNVNYRVQYCDATGDCTETNAQPGTSISLTSKVRPGVEYAWRVVAYDARLHSSAPSDFWYFTVQGNEAAGGDDGGCSTIPGQNFNHYGYFGILFGLFFAGTALRRRRS